MAWIENFKNVVVIKENRPDQHRLLRVPERPKRKRDVSVCAYILNNSNHHNVLVTSTYKGCNFRGSVGASVAPRLSYLFLLGLLFANLIIIIADFTCFIFMLDSHNHKLTTAIGKVHRYTISRIKWDYQLIMNKSTQ